MKKIIPFLALTALLFAGCSKSDMQKSSSQDGIEVLQTVTFTANLATDQTKAYTPKTDGAGASVNRCVIEVYRNGNLYKRDYSVVDQSTKKAVFSLQLPSNRTYDVLFWADCVICTGDTPTEAELQVDNYYVTASGLHNVSINGTYAGNEDKRDAFFGYQSCEVTQSGTSFTGIDLKRPFAQMNVITTDVKEFGVSESDIPTGITVCIKKPYTVIDVQTGALSGNENDITYNGTLYDFPAFEDVPSVTQAKLSMDYIFASDTQEAIDITWTAKTSGASDIVHEFSSIPYRRNYRTNIIGNLLTSVDNWTVTVVPGWTSEIIAVSNISMANSVIAEQVAAGANPINVKFNGQPTDAGVPGSGGHAILTTPLQNGTVLNIEVESSTEQLYVGDYTSEEGTTVETSGLKSAVVNINVPAGKSIGTLVVNAPSKTVYLNGAKIAAAGTITNLDASVSDNTLIINEGQTVKSLTIRQGGLEIHGTVTAATVELASGKNVYVRACEGLSNAVYESLKDYIDSDYESKQIAEDNWSIVLKPVPFAVDGKQYKTIYAAIAAIPEATDKTVYISIAGTYEVIGDYYASPNCDYTIESKCADKGDVIIHNPTGWTDSGHATLKNLTFTCNDSDIDGFLVGLNFTGCTIRGRFDCAYAGNAGELTFDHCTFDCTAKYQYAFWTAGTVPVINVINCEFNTQGKAIKMYGIGNHRLNVEGCIFNDSQKTHDKPAIAINCDYYGYDNCDYTVYIKDCTTDGFDTNKTGDALYGSDNISEISGNLDVLKYDNSSSEYVYVWKDGAKYPPAE